MRTHQGDVGAALPAYDVGDELGRGAYGVVFAGRHRQLDREVAIKELAPVYASDPDVRARFLAEGRRLASLDHPHVVPVYDFVEGDGLCLLVMERLRGGTLGDRAARERLEPPVVCALALAVCAGLHHAHERGLVHRDVKPDNLLFSSAGVLKVADFGIAKVLGGNATVATAAGEVMGTPAFIAPEQIQGRELTPATDVYALATTLYRLLAGRLPFACDGDLASVLYERVHESPRPLLETAPELPSQLAAIIDAALATDPAERHASTEQLGVELARAALATWGKDWLADTGVALASTGPIASAALGDDSGTAQAATVAAKLAPGELKQGREHYDTRAWGAAYESLTLAEQATPLAAEDLEKLAMSAYMLGRSEEYFDRLEQAHQAHLQDGETLRAANCAFWIGINLLADGQKGRANGWFARSQRLVDSAGGDCVEQGYLLYAEMFGHQRAGDLDAAVEAAAGAAAIGERFGDADLVAYASSQHGRLLIKRGQVSEGLGLLDEAMVAVTTGELSPMVSGFVYCIVIIGCQDAYEPRRAKEWTAALARWCDQQPDLVSFTGHCRVHRAEIMQLHGAWPDALDEARRAVERCLKSESSAIGAGAYVQGEVHRLQGDYGAAEEAYREASKCGCEPQPGLALQRLAQGQTDAALAAIRRVTGEATARARRAALLPAVVEIALAAGEQEEADAARRELEQIAAGHEDGMLGAMAAYASGAVTLAAGDPRAAVVSLRHAARVWQELEAPYELARSRVLVGIACRALEDCDAAALELEAAREMFVELGAVPDLARVDALSA